MDGLECCEVMMSDTVSRLDAEYYSKHNTYLQKKLDEVGTRSIADYGGYLDCSAFYPSVAEYYSADRSNIPFLRVNEINNGMINVTDATVFLPEDVLRQNKNTIAIAHPGDIVIAKGGTIAKVGLITDEFPEYAASRDVIILRTDKLEGLNKYYLWAFLHSSYGRGILMRSASQTVQPHLTLPAILAIRVPDIITIQPAIEQLYRCSVQKKRKAEELYTHAQTKLNEELHCERNDISQESITSKSLSDTFSAGRLDAEYFMPKYDEILEHLRTFKTTSIPEEYDIYKNSGTSYSENSQDVGVIKTKQLTNRGINTEGVESWFDNETCSDSVFLKNGDVVFASMGVGSLGKVSIFAYNGDKRFVTDSTLRIWRAKDNARVLPEVLCLFLQSQIGQDIIYRYVVGSTGIINIYDRDIATIPVPILDEEKQRVIAESVRESFRLRKESERMINLAVKSIELAIESDEESAVNHIKEQMNQ